MTFDAIYDDDAFLTAMEFMQDDEASTNLTGTERRMFLLFVAEAMKIKNQQYLNDDIIDSCLVSSVVEQEPLKLSGRRFESDTGHQINNWRCNDQPHE
jgi:hypothetical protein